MASIANFDSYAGYYSQLLIEQTPPAVSFMREYYRLLNAYYLGNGLYDFINQQLKETKTTKDPLKSIRNPAFRVVEFYAAKLFPGKLPGALPIEAESDEVVQAIHSVWAWSNCSSVTQL